MAWYEILLLILSFAGLAFILGYSLYLDYVRHKAYVAERNAQTDLYRELLSAIRDSQ